MRRLQVVVAAFALSASVALAKPRESDFTTYWAEKTGGAEEVTMPDGTRCDVVTETHAIEVEWASNWAESIGQSLWYAFQTNKRAGVVVILRDERDQRFMIRLRSVIQHNKLPIDVWEIRVGEINHQK